ncbi:hypothetical protein LPJ55_005846, partial [Coemansia sp. RSA 990]
MTAKDCTCQVQNTVKAVHENLAEAQEKSAKYYDMGQTEATFKPGQKVLISQQLMVPEYLQSPERKCNLSNQWIGPFEVLWTVGKSHN